LNDDCTMKQAIDYNLFIRFFESYKNQGFKNIEPTAPQLVELEEKMIASKWERMFLTTNIMIKNRHGNYIAEGMVSQQIAETLFLSIHTVTTHRKNILNKTGKRTTHELVFELKERGMI